MAKKKTNKINITVDNKPMTVLEDSFLLPALLNSDFDIPTLCHHKDLTPNGTCRLCIVEVEERGKKRMVTSCNFPVRKEIIVHTQSDVVKNYRKNLAEMYLGRWPNVKVVNDVAEKCGATDKEKYKTELTETSENACILCGHCTRACDEFIQENIIDFAGRGIKRHIAMPFENIDPHCVGCTSCAFVCPTGAIQVRDNRNNPVNAELIQKHGMKVNAEMATLDPYQCRMREVGTANIVDVMANYDLLPVKNFKYGTHPDTWRIDSQMMKKSYFTQGHPDQCWHGCSMACAKAVENFKPRTGPYKGQEVIVDGPEYETAAGSSNMGCFDMDFCVEYNFYCDTYGIDTISFATCVAFVMECYENGIITKEDTGGLELNFGATTDTLELLHQMSRGSGFGVEVGQGVKYLKEKWSKKMPEKAQFINDIGMEVKGLEFSEYVSKESLAQQAGYSLALKGPQHDEAWLIFMDMVNNQIPSFEDKAEALHYFPLFRTWFGLYGLCKIVWNDVVPADNAQKYPPQEAAKIPEHVENYWRFVEGMTGRKVDEKIMLEESARVFNLQKIMGLMLGKNRFEDDIPPYRAVGPVTEEEYESRKERYEKQLVELGFDIEDKTTEEKMELLRIHRYEQYGKVQLAAYKRRGWNERGIPTISVLKELGIDLPELLDVVAPLQ